MDILARRRCKRKLGDDTPTLWIHGMSGAIELKMTIICILCWICLLPISSLWNIIRHPYFFNRMVLLTFLENRFTHSCLHREVIHILLVSMLSSYCYKLQTRCGIGETTCISALLSIRLETIIFSGPVDSLMDCEVQPLC